MNFLDGYFKTGDKMRSKRARQEFYAAIIEFYYKGVEPEFKTEAAEVGFAGIRYSLEESRNQSQRGSKPRPRARKSDSRTLTESQPSTNREIAEAQPKDIPTLTKEEVKEDTEYPPYCPPTEPVGDFPLLCLAALNDELGTPFTRMPSECGRTLAAAEGRFSVDQVRAMVAFKRDDVAGTRWKGILTPNTLFSPDHFEQYMAQSMAERKEADRYAAYD